MMYDYPPIILWNCKPLYSLFPKEIIKEKPRDWIIDLQCEGSAFFHFVSIDGKKITVRLTRGKYKWFKLKNGQVAIKKIGYPWMKIIR